MNVYFATSKSVPMGPSNYPVLWHIITSGAINGSEVQAVQDFSDADLIIVTPFIQWSRRFWFYLRLAKLLRVSKAEQFLFVLKKVFGSQKKFLFVSFENLQHPYWGVLGDIVYNSSVPRITSLPKRFDPNGVRMPYWYNYVRFSSVEFGAFTYHRFGKLFEIDDLMSPLKISFNLDHGCLLARNFNGLRKQVYKAYQADVQIDIYGGHYNYFDEAKPKIELLNEYKYYLATENSLGIGYETEKIPEAWLSGCIPIGCVRVPDGDFNPKVYENRLDAAEFDFPLLLVAPDLQHIIKYIGETIYD